MAPSLLKTKFYIPPVRSNLVPRPRLVEQLNQSLRPGCRLTLVSAPAGFGKTTLLAHWIQQLKGPAAWLSLDAGDNHPVRFWSYLVSALQAIEEDVGQAALARLQSAQPPPIEPVVTNLLNEIAETDREWVLVLDDYHVIAEPAIHDALGFLVDYLPPRMHLILASRADPPWPLARLRARGAMLELRTEDLRFTQQETSAFLNAAMGLDLSARDVALLDARTEGWVAGLQLAALAMQGAPAQGPGGPTGFIRAFSGSHRFILDYLVEQVLDRQPEQIRTFLVQTSILERLTASLCDAVVKDGTGKGKRLDSQAILVELEHNNLFVVPLDDQRRWYRYHHLFADLLSSRLSQHHPDLIPALHRRASAWYEAQGLIAEAIEHGLLGSDLERVGQLIAGNTLAMMEHGELDTLKGLLETVPQSEIQAQPWLSLAQAWIDMFTGHLDAVEPLLAAVEGVLADRRADRATEEMAGHIAAIRAGVPFIQGDMAQAVMRTQQALEAQTPAAPIIRGWMTMNLGLALGWQGHLERSEGVMRQALEIARTRQVSHLYLLTLCNLASTQKDRGHLVQAAATFGEAIELGHSHAGRSGQPLPVTGYAYVYLGGIQREWNDLDAAQEQVERGVRLCVQWGEPQLLTSAYLEQARIRFSAGDLDGSRAAIQNAKQVANKLSNWYAGRAAACEIDLLLTQDDDQAAAREAGRLSCQLATDAPRDLYEGMICLALTRLAIAQGRPSQALQWVPKLLTLYRSAGSIDGQIRTLIQQCIALQARGEGAQALDALQHALALAEPQGYVRTFVEASAPLEELLQQALVRDISTSYVHKLLTARSTLPASSPAFSAQPSTLLDPLTERERQILRLLPTHLSSTEIADQLYVSKNTVRSHIGHIYDKLGVHSRVAAVERAQELGLI